MPESLAYAVLAARYDGLMRNAINAYCVSEIRKKMIKMMPLSPDLWVLSYIDMLLSALKPLSPSSPDKLNICGKKKKQDRFMGRDVMNYSSFYLEMYSPSLNGKTPGIFIRPIDKVNTRNGFGQFQ